MKAAAVAYTTAVVVVVLNRDVCNVVRRRAHRDLVNLRRHLSGDGPRPRRCRRHEPHALEAHVVEVTNLQDVLVRVDRALHGGRRDWLELGCAAVIRDLGSCHGLADARGLWNLREQDGLGGLRRAGHGRQHARPFVLERNLLEGGRQAWRGECPWAGEIWCREPSARDEEVDRTLESHPEHIAVGVADPEELRRTLDGQVARFASQQDQFRRCQTDEHRGRLAGAHPGARETRLHLFPVVVRRQLREAPRQRARWSPRSFHIGRLQPDLFVAQVIGLGWTVFEQIPVGVDRRGQVVLWNGRPNGVAVDIDKNGGSLTEEDRRRIRLQAVHVLRDDLAHVDVRQHAIERDHTLLERHRSLDLRDEGSEADRAGAWGSWTR